MRKKLILTTLFFLSLLLYGFAQKNNIKDSVIVYKFDIKDEIGPKVWRFTQKSLENAKKLNADYVLIHMNTYGGLLDAADSVRTAILNFDKPVLVFIDNNAASAGALISIACDSVYMRQGANFGAATVVNQNGEPLPDKYQSYMRSMMRSTAEAHGKDTIINGTDTSVIWHRDPKIAEAMVDPDVFIEGISDSGKVLTFTVEEAIKNHYCEAQAENIDEVMKKAGIKNYIIKEYKPSTLDIIIGFLASPYLQSILIMIIIGGIYFELQTPGIGFPLAASAIAAVLYFAPLYLEGLAENWEILIFIIGIALLLVEIFVTPGFGVAGISGVILIIAGMSMSLIDNIIFDYNLDFLSLMAISLKALFRVIFSIFIALVLLLIFTPKIIKTPAFSFLVLDTKENRNEGFIGVDEDYKYLIGAEGIAATMLRPAGKIEINNDIYDATALYGYIDKNEKIRVVKFETGQLYVEKANTKS